MTTPTLGESGREAAGLAAAKERETAGGGELRLDADDRFAIADVIALSAHCSDFQDWDGFAQVYTEDAETRTDSHDYVVTGLTAHVEHGQHSAKLTSGKNRHLYFNLRVVATAEGAEATYYLVNCDAGSAPGDTRIVTTGRMWAALARTPDGWRIRRRRFSPDQAYKIDW